MSASARRALFACAAALSFTACQPTASGTDDATSTADEAVQGIVVSDAWIRETPPNAGVAGGYLTLRSGAADRLVAVETAAASSVEIHEMRHEGGVMRMRELGDGVALAAGETVELKPGGLHLMFIEPVEPMRAGVSIEATLRFQTAPAQSVRFEVRPLGAQAEDAHAGH